MADKLRIVASEQLALQPVHLKQDISGDSLSFFLQELPQTIHCSDYALVNQRISSSQTDATACALHKSS